MFFQKKDSTFLWKPQHHAIFSLEIVFSNKIFKDSRTIKIEPLKSAVFTKNYFGEKSFKWLQKWKKRKFWKFIGKKKLKIKFWKKIYWFFPFLFSVKRPDLQIAPKCLPNKVGTLNNDYSDFHLETLKNSWYLSFIQNFPFLKLWRTRTTLSWCFEDNFECEILSQIFHWDWEFLYSSSIFKKYRLYNNK